MQTIPLVNLAIAILPVLGLILVLYFWTLDWQHAIYGVGRMVLQLLLIGYLLTYIFETNQSLVVGLVLLVMVTTATWIALGTVPDLRKRLYGTAITSIAIAGGLTLLLITQFVLDMDTWYSPQQVIPLAGMIFATSMNSISLSAERLTAELGRGVTYAKARVSHLMLPSSRSPIHSSLLVWYHYPA